MNGQKKKPLLLVEALAARNDSGLGKLVRMFVEGLAGLADFAEIKVIVSKEADFIPGPHCSEIRVTPKPMRVWNQIAFPFLIRKLKPQAVLCLGWTLPLWRPKSKYGLLIADIGPMENLGFAMSSRDRANRRWLKRMPIQADLILTNAAFTQKRMQALLGIASEKIKVIKPIQNARFAESGESDRVRPPSHLSPLSPPTHPYFLAIGNIEPRKNFPGLIAAYARLKARRPDAPPLYILGHKAWGFKEAEAITQKLGLTDSVLFMGYLSNKERNAYLAQCTVFISSSLYEGWGLPLFEALALERPAIYHAHSSQEEFAKGLALGINCADPDALSQAMETLWIHPLERNTLQAALRVHFPKIQGYDLQSELRTAISPLLQ